MPSNLTPKQEAFCFAYLKTGNASEAYRQAYDAENMKPEVIWVKACELLSSGKVAVRVEELRKAIAERAEISQAWVLERLVENANRAMQAIPVRDPEGDELGEYTYQGNVANKALELVGKEMGMFIDKKEIAGKDGKALEIKVEWLTDD